MGLGAKWMILRPLVGANCRSLIWLENQRIEIAGRKGTFWGYYQIKNFPNVIEWYPDDKNFELDVTIWTQGGILVSEWDEKDSVSEEENDFGMWENEL